MLTRLRQRREAGARTLGKLTLGDAGDAFLPSLACGLSSVCGWRKPNLGFFF
jgi:hypothetical protein